MQMAGGHSQVRAVTEDEDRQKLNSFQSTVQEKAGQEFEQFEAVQFTSQVVAGMFYHVKYKVGDDRYVHARVFQPLPYTQ